LSARLENQALWACSPAALHLLCAVILSFCLCPSVSLLCSILSSSSPKA
jgi:hypothetical protein